MNDYIRREAAKKTMSRFKGYGPIDDDMIVRFGIALDNIPAADVRPVVRGMWLEDWKHRWQTDERGEVDVFAGVDVGYHNGPLCVNCGYSFCEHCDPDGYDSECEVPTETCSECGFEAHIRTPFCPNCGADMRPREVSE